MIQVFEMVVLIVAISCAAGVLNNYLKNRGGGRQAKELEGRLDDRMRQIDALEKRVQVLEKIVTDRNYDLKRELHDLEHAD